MCSPLRLIVQQCYPVLQGSFWSLFFSDEHCVWITEVVLVMFGQLLKALDTIGNYSNKLLAQKTSLVRSNGELLIV